MKKIMLLAGLVILASINIALAQTPTPPVPPPPATGALVDSLSLSQAASDLASSGLFKATNYSFNAYATYAPKIAAKDRWGGGALAVYNLNQYVGAGLGVDYLGHFSLVSGNATLKYPINVGKYLVQFSPSLGSLEVTPFVLGGIGTPLGGSPSSVSVITDEGLYVKFGHLYKGQFVAGACYGQWDNAGDYSGKRAHLFAGWERGF